MHFSSIMDFSSFVQSEWSIAFENRFRFLKRIPSSGVLPSVAVFEAHPEMFTPEFVVRMAVNPSMVPKETRDLVFRMFSKERSAYIPVRDIKEIIRNRLRICENDEERGQLEEARALYENVSTPSAKDTRQVFFPRLKAALGSKPRNLGGGNWGFPVILGNRQMELVLDFGGLHTGFRHSIDVIPDKSPSTILFVSYEEIMGFGYAPWDLMQDKHLDQHAETFVEVVNRTLRALAVTAI